LVVRLTVSIEAVGFEGKRFNRFNHTWKDRMRRFIDGVNEKFPTFKDQIRVTGTIPTLKDNYAS